MRKLCSLLESISRNPNVEKHGKRYTAPMQSFFEVILLWGGPWLANFVSLHIFGPEIHTLFRWRKKQICFLGCRIDRTQFPDSSEDISGGSGSEKPWQSPCLDCRRWDCKHSTGRLFRRQGRPFRIILFMRIFVHHANIDYGYVINAFLWELR